MKRSSLLLAACVAVAATGCDSLHARQIANDAAGLYKKGDLQGAAERYEEAAKLDPSLAPVQLNLGFTYLSLYQASPKSKVGHEAGGKALAAFEKYIQLKPSDERGRQYLVQTFVDTARYDDAVAYFKPEVEKNPPSLEAIRTLGLIAAKTGRLADALTWYQRRCDLQPNDHDGHYNLGVLIWDHLHNHTEVIADARVALADRGLAALHKAADLRPHAPEAYTYINLLYRERAKAWVGQMSPFAQTALAPNPCGFVPPEPPSPTPAPPVDPVVKKLWDDADVKRQADCKQADDFMKTAMEKLKAQGGYQPPAQAEKK